MMLLAHIILQLFFGSLITVNALAVFTKDRVVLWREASAGVSQTAILLARATIDLLPTTIAAVFYATTSHLFTRPVVAASDMVLLHLAIAFYCSGMGLLDVFT